MQIISTCLLSYAGHSRRCLSAIPTKALTAKDIIMQHTLYPYYTRFFSTNRKKSAYMLALNGNRHAGQHIGIYQSSSMDARRLRYCPRML